MVLSFRTLAEVQCRQQEKEPKAKGEESGWAKVEGWFKKSTEAAVVEAPSSGLDR